MADKESRTEKPTPRRRKKARQEGSVPQSAEVTNAVALLGAVLALWLFGARCFRIATENVTDVLRDLSCLQGSQTGVVQLLREEAFVVVRAGAPIMFVMALVGVACSIAQTGWLFLPKNLRPNLSVLSPVKNIRELISFRAVVGLITAVLKLVLVGFVVYLVLRKRLNWLWALADREAWSVVAALREVCMDLMLKVALAMLLVAAIDYAYRRYKHEQKLMMTKQEKKDEYKSEVGDPKVKQRQWEARIKLAVGSFARAVPTADVVVTNPTSVAVALRWDEKEMNAPQVVAKGQRHRAERIKEIAREHGVPVVERRELARALYVAVEVGMEIPSQLYYAVAEVLAFVMGRRRGTRARVSA
jgi:flagellar biosynthetic protein FlhB